jgi:hypothetical protein
MTSIRITLAALAFFAATIAQASEITEFPITTSASLTRADVVAEARKKVATSSLNYNFAGPSDAKAPVSTKSRDEVRKEVTASRANAVKVAGSDLVGGM